MRAVQAATCRSPTKKTDTWPVLSPQSAVFNVGTDGPANGFFMLYFMQYKTNNAS